MPVFSGISPPAATAMGVTTRQHPRPTAPKIPANHRQLSASRAPPRSMRLVRDERGAHGPRVRIVAGAAALAFTRAQSFEAIAPPRDRAPQGVPYVSSTRTCLRSRSTCPKSGVRHAGKRASRQSPKRAIRKLEVEHIKNKSKSQNFANGNPQRDAARVNPTLIPVFDRAWH